MPGDLAAAGTGEESDQRALSGLRRGGRMFEAPGANPAGERMSNEGGGDAALSEPAFLKGEDAEKLPQMSAHGRDAAFAPGPGLGSDHLDNGNPEGMEGSSNTGVKGLVVDENRQGRTFVASRPHEAAELAVNGRQMGDDFGEADHGELRRIDDRADTGAGEAIAGGAEELPIRMTSQESLDERGRVVFSGRFAGRHEELHLFR